MKKFAGGILIFIGIILAIPVGFRIMHLMGYLVGVLFDPVGSHSGYSITFLATTIVLISLMIIAFRYGSKFWKGEEKNEAPNDNIDSGL